MNEELLSLNAIDFLPQRYREAKMKRSASLWRLLVVFALAGMLLSTIYFQQRVLWEAQADLVKIEPLHAAATKLAKEMTEEQAKFPQADKEAELFTYLRYPWPRTQILAAVLTPVPKSVRLTSLKLSFELPEKKSGETVPTTKDDPIDKTPSAARDLKRLREQLDGGHWVVSLAGTSSELAELHSYLSELEHCKLFSTVNLVSIESPQSAETSNSHFAVRIVLRPGYGQPGGPAISAEAPTNVTSYRGSDWERGGAT